jgi:hypothetical protein
MGCDPWYDSCREGDFTRHFTARRAKYTAAAAQQKVARLPLPTQWRKTGPHIQIKGAAQQSGPVPIRGSCFCFVAVHTLLARCGDDRGLERAVRRDTASVAHQVDTWQGHECRKLLEQLQWRKFDTGASAAAAAGGPVCCRSR